MFCGFCGFPLGASPWRYQGGQKASNRAQSEPRWTQGKAEGRPMGSREAQEGAQGVPRDSQGDTRRPQREPQGPRRDPTEPSEGAPENFKEGYIIIHPSQGSPREPQGIARKPQRWPQHGPRRGYMIIYLARGASGGLWRCPLNSNRAMPNGVKNEIYDHIPGLSYLSRASEGAIPNET